MRFHLHRDKASEAAPALHTTIIGEVGEKERMGRTDSSYPRVRDGNSMVGVQGAISSERQRYCAPDQTHSGMGDLRRSDTQRRLGGDATIGRKNVDDARLLHKRRKITVYQQSGVTGEPQDSREFASSGRAAVAVASSSSTMSVGQCRGHKVWKGRSKSVPGDEHAGSRLFRLEGDPSVIDRLPISRRCTERHQQYPFKVGDDTSRVATPPSIVSGGVSPTGLNARGGFIRQQAKSSAEPVLLLRARLRGRRNECFQFGVGTTGNGVRISPPGADSSPATEIAIRQRPKRDCNGASLDSPIVVANNVGDADLHTPPVTQRGMDNPGPVGPTDVGGEVVDDRRTFIRKFGLREGISEAVLERGWASLKTGYISKYDPHFERFGRWWKDTNQSGRFSPNSIRAGVLADFLENENARGLRHASLKDACASISVACSEALGSSTNLGSTRCVARLMKDIRLREAPQGRKHDMQKEGVGDVVLLLQEAFLYGPNEALCLGHLKEKLILTLAVDTGARPSDLHKLFRIRSGHNCQIKFTYVDEGYSHKEKMELRYFWPKEVDPFSSRSNSTSVWFSSWVPVWCSKPSAVCSHCIMKFFLEVSSDPSKFASVLIPELETSAQPMFWALKRQGKLQQASVDHISNIISSGLRRAGLGHMSCQSVRGATTSKIAQCAPALRPELLKLGRWTTEETFRKSYETEIVRVPRLDDEDASSCQQVMRWGFNPTLPTDQMGRTIISQEDYYRLPDHWVGRTYACGKIVNFEDGVFSVRKNRKVSSLYHYELMQAMSTV